MAPVRDVPDVTGKKMVIGARHPECLELPFQYKKANSKPLYHTI